MKRVTLIAVVVGLLVALTATVALAATISCPNRANGLCVGTEQGDFMQGSLGNDIMRGRGGNDTMIGGVGNDTIHATDGSDRLEGRIGDDFLAGESGNDTILTADGRDEAHGASGNDVIRAYRDGKRDYINCGTGYDIADVQLEDHIVVGDGTIPAVDLVSTTLTSCERIFVNDILVVNNPLPIVT